MRDVEGIGFMRFSENDVVRHPLVQSIIRAYDRHNAESSAARLAGGVDAPREDGDERPGGGPTAR
jgi:hypothetical protein